MTIPSGRRTRDSRRVRMVLTVDGELVVDCDVIGSPTRAGKADRNHDYAVMGWWDGRITYRHVLRTAYAGGRKARKHEVPEAPKTAA